MSDTIKNIITFGGHKKVVIALEEFNKVRDELEKLNKQHNTEKKTVKSKGIITIRISFIQKN